MVRLNKISELTQVVDFLGTGNLSGAVYKEYKKSVKIRLVKKGGVNIEYKLSDELGIDFTTSFNRYNEDFTDYDGRIDIDKFTAIIKKFVRKEKIQNLGF